MLGRKGQWRHNSHIYDTSYGVYPDDIAPAKLVEHESDTIAVDVIPGKFFEMKYFLNVCVLYFLYIVSYFYLFLNHKN